METIAAHFPHYENRFSLRISAYAVTRLREGHILSEDSRKCLSRSSTATWCWREQTLGKFSYKTERKRFVCTPTEVQCDALFAERRVTQKFIKKFTTIFHPYVQYSFPALTTLLHLIYMIFRHKNRPESSGSYGKHSVDRSDQQS